MTGICGGFKKEVSIGDAVLATQTWNWQSGKYISEAGTSHLVPDADVFRVSDSVISSFEQIAADSAFLHDVRSAYDEDKPAKAISLKMGPMASGSTVLADDSVIRSIAEQVSRKVSAVDMETYGVYAASAFSGKDSIKAFAVKGVSDYADEAKNDSFRQYAAYVSAKVCDAFLTRYGYRFVRQRTAA
jgi:nucleoside phosphorylase